MCVVNTQVELARPPSAWPWPQSGHLCASCFSPESGPRGSVLALLQSIMGSVSSSTVPEASQTRWVHHDGSIGGDELALSCVNLAPQNSWMRFFQLHAPPIGSISPRPRRVLRRISLEGKMESSLSCNRETRVSMVRAARILSAASMKLLVVVLCQDCNCPRRPRARLFRPHQPDACRKAAGNAGTRHGHAQRHEHIAKLHAQLIRDGTQARFVLVPRWLNSGRSGSSFRRASSARAGSGFFPSRSCGAGGAGSSNR